MNHRLKSLAVVVVAAALTAAGCSSNGERSAKSESSGTRTPSAESSVLRIKDKGVTAKGGTVYVLQAFGFDALDPANAYKTDSMEVGRLIYRTLTFIKDTPGEDPSIQPDLAETLGTPSDGGRTWTYRLRAGLKYEDGRPITARDIKYGVMRSFDRDVFSLGATWMPDLLENETGFESPYATPEKDLSSVETPDDRTLIFHFSGSQPDADWIMAMPRPCPRTRTRSRTTTSVPSRRGRTRSRTTNLAHRLRWYVTRIGIPQPIPTDPHIPIASSSNSMRTRLQPASDSSKATVTTPSRCR